MMGHTLSLVDGHVFSCGCGDGGEGFCQSSCQEFTPSNSSWAAYCTLMTPRWGHTAVTLSSSLNIMGGRFAGGKQFERIIPYAELKDLKQHGPVLLQVTYECGL